MTRIAGPLLAAILLIASRGLACAEVLTTPGYSERDTPADLPSPERDRRLDVVVDVQAPSSGAQNGQMGYSDGSGFSNSGTRPFPGRYRHR